jgi:hypothetical protein
VFTRGLIGAAFLLLVVVAFWLLVSPILAVVIAMLAALGIGTFFAFSGNCHVRRARGTRTGLSG